ncbi:MAG: bifunctional riboflavin kinase/FAD synthetase [Nocardioidaceae bacterium]|nr:bifunctional riboflavin kinase/FAD synthetase [Nocardioidaceae bacterium]
MADTLVAGQRLPVVAVTFYPHPLIVVAPAYVPLQLTSVEQRIPLLLEAGADHVYVLAFTAEMSQWTPEEFVQRILVDELQAAAIVVGDNFRYGVRGSGDVAYLKFVGERFGFVVEGLALDGDETPWSSTYVRQLLSVGDVTKAAEVLGRPHSVSGIVIRGDQRGRELGFPTANIPAPAWAAVPADGVYAGWLSWDGQEPLPAAVSVGSNPTFDGVERRVESYVLDRTDLELYGREITVEFVQHIRGQEKFDDIDALVAKVWDDVDKIRAILG